VDLAALGVHHDGDGEALLLVEAPDGADGGPMPLPVAVAHVEPGHVHPADGERLELVRARGGGAHGADELGAARAPEPVLPQLGLRGGVHVDGPVGREDPVRVRGEGGEVGGGRGGGAEAEGEAVRAEMEEGSGRGRREGRAGGGPVGLWCVQEGVGGGGHGDGPTAAGEWERWWTGVEWEGDAVRWRQRVRTFWFCCAVCVGGDCEAGSQFAVGGVTWRDTFGGSVLRWQHSV
jgi:hypothetical protein